MTTKTITLETPIQRGETTITQIQLRKPMAGELRGVSLANLIQMDVGAVITVLPRISSPSVLQQEAERMDPADLMQVAAEVAGFLLTKSALTESLTASNPSGQTLQ